ncbi:TetR family transcriptional regulator [Hoeflea marina]|uniref:TetR family transcriptional regulator n=1 Tax=Hoeflea marina TaxID=274592 RepID=A0A317PPT7_9HYPH|nr:TetR/AcrR family transcriptional regulator [Hoeflea marina]PWW02159.1 TetR family transcriptional regulator [Hoeflea marina]
MNDKTDLPGCPGELLRQGRRVAGQDPVKRDQILDGAHRVFTRLGFDASSMNDITREANVSKGTIYVYFANKEELFETLMERERQRIFSDSEMALTGQGTIAERLMRYGTLIVRLVCSDVVIRAHRVILGVGERMPEMAARFYERGPQKGKQALALFMKAEVEAGNLVIDDVEFAAHQFSDLCMAAIFRPRLFGYMANEPTTAEIERSVGGAVAMFMAYYAPRPGAGAA